MSIEKISNISPLFLIVF